MIKKFSAWLIFVLASPWATASEPVCADLFEAVAVTQPTEPVVAQPKVEPAVKAEFVIVNGKRLTPEEAASVLESGPVFVERLDITPAEIRQAVQETRRFLNDPSITEKDVHDAMFAAKNKYDAQIDSLVLNAGQSLSITVRNMRKRRLMFADALQARETVKAAHIYRNLWEAYYISKSKLLEYTLSKSRQRDKHLVESSKWILLGITKGFYPDLYRQVDKAYANERVPNVSEILSLYDQIFARSNDEFRYAVWFVNQKLADPTISEEAKADIDYVIQDRLGIDRMAARFGLKVYTQRYLDSKDADKLLNQSRPQIVIWALKRMRNEQIRFGTALYIGAAIENVLLTLVRKIPSPWLSQGLESIVILNRNAYLLRSHLERVEAVVNAPPAERLDVLQTELGKLGMSKEEGARFLELFARLSEDMTVWNQLKGEVDKLAKDNVNYKELLELMTAAEAGIKTHGFISKFYSATVYDYSMALMLRGTPLAIAMFTNWSSVAQWFEGVFLSAATIVQYIPFVN